MFESRNGTTKMLFDAEYKTPTLRKELEPFIAR
jgi:hypothetical protein